MWLRELHDRCAMEWLVGVAAVFGGLLDAKLAYLASLASIAGIASVAF